MSHKPVTCSMHADRPLALGHRPPMQMEAQLLSIGKNRASVVVHSFCSDSSVPSHQNRLSNGKRGPSDVLHAVTKLQYKVLSVQEFNQHFGEDSCEGQVFVQQNDKIHVHVCMHLHSHVCDTVHKQVIVRHISTSAKLLHGTTFPCQVPIPVG